MGLSFPRSSIVNGMEKRMELLAPGGDIDAIKAAIVAGADAIYCGLDRFNARNRAENISFADLNGIIRLAHKNDCEVFLTLNIIIVESEIPALVTLLNKLVNTRIDGVIVQDLGLFYLLSNSFTDLVIHASTQLTTHNEGQIQFLKKLNASRVNLSRELSLAEITALSARAHKENILTEVFVHGSQCLSFSGLCYLSSVNGGNSGNRGRCSQPCRDQYVTTAAGKNFPLNLKDNCAYFDLRKLAEAGVDSIKIEGRIKKFHYVYTVVKSYREQLQCCYRHNTLTNDNRDLHKVFNRDFSNGYLKGDINTSMFIDNPRDNSAIHRAETDGAATPEKIQEAKRELYDLKTEIITDVRARIKPLSIKKAPLTITVSGKKGLPLQVSVKTPDCAFSVFSDIDLLGGDPCSTTNGLNQRNKQGSGQYLSSGMLLKRFAVFNETEFFIEDLQLQGLAKGLFLPFRELTEIKKKILFILNDSKETAAPIDIPRLKKPDRVKIAPTLSLLISSRKDLHLCHETTADIYFQLPNSFTDRYSEFVDLFMENKELIPWFPAVLIGEEYRTAVRFLKQVQVMRIVTNNMGIAYAAYCQGIPWIAGPHLNIVNSFSLLCLKDKFNCYGSFISNEINRMQIKGIRKPDDFRLYYSIFHPIMLMTSRQCLLHQVTGCKKQTIDDECVQQCAQSSSITNLKNIKLLIKKTKGNYHRLYGETHFLNTDILADVPSLFSSLFIDLRDIKTNTIMERGKAETVALFEQHLSGKPGSTEELIKAIHPSTNSQYRKGI